MALKITFLLNTSEVSVLLCFSSVVNHEAQNGARKRELHFLKSFSLPHKAFTPAVNKVKPSRRKWKPKTDSGRYKGNGTGHLRGSLMPVSHTLNRDRCWGSAHLHTWDSWHLKRCFHLLISQIFKRVALNTEKNNWKHKQALTWRHFIQF